MIVEKKIKSILEPRLSILFFPIVLKVCRVEEIDWWDEFLNDEQDDYSINEQNLMSMPPILIFLLSTWTHGKLPPTSMCLLESLVELLTDWRVSPRPLSLKNDMPLHVASFGIGSSAYNNSTFCKPSKEVFKKCLKLGAKSLLGSTKMRKNNSNKLSSKNLGWYNEVGMGDNEKGDDCNVQSSPFSLSPIPTSLYQPKFLEESLLLLFFLIFVEPSKLFAPNFRHFLKTSLDGLQNVELLYAELPIPNDATCKGISFFKLSGLGDTLQSVNNSTRDSSRHIDVGGNFP
jgi:flavodoxin